jgi:hypothetical protein
LCNGGASSTFAVHFEVIYGDSALTLPINSDVYVPISIYSGYWPSWIGFLHIPLATSNSYITQRYTNGIFYDSLLQWDDVSFLAPWNNYPTWNLTSQSILGWADLFGERNPWLHPVNKVLIAKFKMRTINDTTLIGQTREVFSAGAYPTSNGLTICDTLGNVYTDTGKTFYPVTFCACADSDHVGTGRGIIGSQNHIDTECYTDSFALYDITRRAGYNPHGHNGQMQASGSIMTYKYRPTPPEAVIMKDIDNNWGDSVKWPGVDAHVYSGWVYDFMNSSLNRNGYDNSGLTTTSWVEVPYPQWHNIALYNNGRAIFGTVDQAYRSLAGCPDVVAHEWGHGITENEANLLYQKESGALSESFSDMFAAAFNDGYLNDHTTWWKIGRNFYRNNPNQIVTDMQNPNNTNQAQTYQNDQFWVNITNCTTPDISNDYCGVHANCGVPNKMFYLLAAGGTFNGINVQSIGVQNAFRIMYEANRQSFWPSNATFWNARDGCIRAALQIDTTTHTARNVADAWNAVGVCDTCDYIPGDVNGNGEARGSDITLLVAFLKQQAPPPPDSCHMPYQINGRDWFYVTADYNGDCQILGSDVTWGVAFYKGFRPEIRHCPHFSPSLP